MPFDGRDYRNITLIRPYAYYPKTPEEAVAFSETLRASYFHARHHGRFCWDTSYAMDLQQPDVQRIVPDVITSTTPVALGAGYHWLPPKATHLVALILFSFVDVAPQTLAHFRLIVATNEGMVDPDEGAETRVRGPGWDIDPLMGPQNHRILVPEDVFSPYDEAGTGNAAALVDVAIDIADPGDGGAMRFSKVIGFCDNAPLGVAVPQPMRPQEILCWWECRG